MLIWERRLERELIYCLPRSLFSPLLPSHTYLTSHRPLRFQHLLKERPYFLLLAPSITSGVRIHMHRPQRQSLLQLRLKLSEVEDRGLVVVVTAFVVLPGGVDAWKE